MTHPTQTADIIFLHGRKTSGANHDVQERARKARLARLAKAVSASGATRQVVDAWLVGTEGDRLMLMLGDAFGHHTQFVDLAPFAEWLHSHHPEIYDGKSSILSVDLHGLSSDVLEEALAHCRSKRVEKATVKIVGLITETGLAKSAFDLYYTDAGWGNSGGGQRW